MAEIKSISKDDGYIYYINRYKATAVIEYLSKEATFPFSFYVEINPLGMRSYHVNDLPRDLDYPLLPIRKALKEYIIKMDKNRELP
ncbi:MAG: hypothetical protein K6G18_11155 [Treponema sp.]|nr:hypothetical protein [Treponema sp.]MCR5622393.1 hypothetical protein [Treponema sp.]